MKLTHFLLAVCLLSCVTGAIAQVEPPDQPMPKHEREKYEKQKKERLEAARKAAVAKRAKQIVGKKDEGPKNPLLHPELLKEKAPDVFKARFETSRGEFIVEVHRQWAPHGADRFYNLVKNGYFDGCRFFRVISGFMAQVGLHGSPKVTKAWTRATIKDDPIKKPNTRGMVTFAMTGAPNSRTTQIFINFGDNTRLSQHGKFAPFGRVVKGMRHVDALYSRYGEGAPRGVGPSQGKLTNEGNKYLAKSFPKLDYIKKARIVGKDDNKKKGSAKGDQKERGRKEVKK